MSREKVRNERKTQRYTVGGVSCSVPSFLLLSSQLSSLTSLTSLLHFQWPPSACVKSSSRSRQCSVPMEILTSESVMPASVNSSSLSSLCVVVRGWQTSVSTPPRL